MNRAVLYAPLAALCAFATNAQAQYTTVDLSSYVNQGFADSWFINGAEFAPIIGNTFGNQGSAVPFDVANVQSSPTSGIDNNFWYGLFGGSKRTITIPVTTPGVRTVYTLADNTFGKDHDNIEFTVEFQGTVGTVIEYYWGAINTKDYTHDCTTTGCDATPTAKYWFVDASGSQWLQIQNFSFPAAFGLYSITFAQTDPTDGAILAGLTLSTAAVPEISTWAMMLLGLAGLGYAGRSRPAWSGR